MGVLLLLLLLLLQLAELLAAALNPTTGLQEQEINLKLRILVPRDSRQLTQTFNPFLASSVSPKPQIPLMPDLLGLTSLPLRTPAAPQPLSVVSSLSSVSAGGTPLGSLMHPPVSHLTHAPIMGSYLVARPMAYRKVPVRTVYSTYPTQLPNYAPRAPVIKVLRTSSYHTWPQHSPHAGLQYNIVSSLPPKRINITMVQSSKPESPSKTCNCTDQSESEKQVEEDPSAEDEDEHEDAPTTAKPIPDAWLGYIPPDLLDHAKNVLFKGKVNVEKDKVHFRQKWKHSNYPKHHQQQKLPGVGEDLWNDLKEDLKDLNLKDVNADFHDHDAEFDDTATDGFDDGHEYETIQTEEDDGQPHFVDFWGNRVPKYRNGFLNSQQTEAEAEREYNNDPNGWNPDYTKGMWSDNDQHLQVFSGYQNQDPDDPKPTYNNGLGENHDANYNKYVADNGTWVGKPSPSPPNNLREILKDSVSYEEGLENPSDGRATYADVIRYLNSKKIPIRVRRRKKPKKRLRSGKRPNRYRLRPKKTQPATVKPTVQPTQNNPNLVDINQLVEALILHKEREKALKQAAVSQQRNSIPDDQGDDYEDEEVDDEDDFEVDEVEDDKPPARISNAHGSPPVSICKGIRDVGVTQDGHEMAHVQGVICSNSYDFSAEEGTLEAANEAEKSDAQKANENDAATLPVEQLLTID